MLFYVVYTANYRLSSVICSQSGNQTRCENNIFYIVVIYEMLWWTACEVNRMSKSCLLHLSEQSEKEKHRSLLQTESGRAWISVLHTVSFQADWNIYSVWGMSGAQYHREITFLDGSEKGRFLTTSFEQHPTLEATTVSPSFIFSPVTWRCVQGVPLECPVLWQPCDCSAHHFTVGGGPV